VKFAAIEVEVIVPILEVIVTLRSRRPRLHRTPAEREIRVISRRFGAADNAPPAQ
jgi:hypothetical protein